MGKLIVFSALLGLFVVDPAAAQGTARQRAACERDAHRFCAAEQPDAIAVERCLRAHFKLLSKACRRELQAGRR